MNDRGTALLLAIFLATALAAAAAAAALTARSETLVAGAFQQGLEALYVADGALARAVHDLAALADWNDALRGAPRAGQPAFRLFSVGPAAGWLPGGRVASDFRVEVWVADDPADTDGDPLADSNGALVVHSEARGPSRARRAVRALVERGRVVSWHEWTW